MDDVVLRERIESMRDKYAGMEAELSRQITEFNGDSVAYADPAYSARVASRNATGRILRDLNALLNDMGEAAHGG